MNKNPNKKWSNVYKINITIFKLLQHWTGREEVDNLLYILVLILYVTLRWHKQDDIQNDTIFWIWKGPKHIETLKQRYFLWITRDADF